jgi:predicted signal transduction protein with EAL and GGDEF domain
VLAGKLIDAISAPLQIGNRLLAIRPSVGISVTPDHGNRSEELMRHADLAMYHAKRHGPGFAFHHPSRPTPV